MLKVIKRIKDVAVEYGLGAIYPLVALLSFFYHPKIYRNPHPTKGTIVIVFCWFSPNIAHNKWITYLEKKGFRTYLVWLPLLFEDFPMSAARLDRFITHHKLKNYTLVGISTGALISIYFLHVYKKWSQIHRFISVGGPLHGTPKAWLISFCKKGRDMLPRSKFITRLRGIVVPQKKMVTISVTYDELVPKHSNEWPGAKTYRISGWGHNSFHLSKSETYQLITKITEEKE